MKTSHPSLPYLTGFRAIAAYLVLFGHSVGTAFNYRGISFLHEYTAVFTYLGMTLFFVLSGFVITYSYYHHFRHNRWWKAARYFAVARFARLYPLYVLLFILETYSLRILWAAPPAGWLSYLTMTQSWWNVQSYVLAPTWSVSTEWFFYFAFAIAMVCTAWRGKEATFQQTKKRALWFFIGLLAFLAGIFWRQDDVVTSVAPYLLHRSPASVLEWVGYYSPYIRIGEFILGAFAARLYMLSDTAETSRFNGIFCIACCLAIGGIGWYNMSHFGYATFLFFLSKNFGYAPFIAYLLYACGRHPNIFTRMLSGKWLLAAGEISYSIYLMQFWVFHMLHDYLPSATWTDPGFAESALLCLNVVIYFVATTLVAMVTYRFVEVPARTLIRRLGRA